VHELLPTRLGGERRAGMNVLWLLIGVVVAACDLFFARKRGWF
jgi:hypothetical protein